MANAIREVVRPVWPCYVTTGTSGKNVVPCHLRSGLRAHSGSRGSESGHRPCAVLRQVSHFTRYQPEQTCRTRGVPQRLVIVDKKRLPWPDRAEVVQMG